LLAVFELVLVMIAPRYLPVRYYAFHAIQEVHFLIMLVSRGPQNERYNEVAVYLYNGVSPVWTTSLTPVQFPQLPINTSHLLAVI